MSSIELLAKLLAKTWSLAVRAEVSASNSIVNLWPKFRVNYAEDFQKWLKLSPFEKNNVIPHTVLDSEIAQTGSNVAEQLDTTLLPQFMKDFIKAEGVEIWSAKTIENLARKKLSFNAEEMAEFLEFHQGTKAVYILKNRIGNTNPVVFIADHALDEANAIATGKDYLSFLAHEVGHLIDEYLGRASGTLEFGRAFATDINRLQSTKADDLISFAKIITEGRYNHTIAPQSLDVLQEVRLGTTKYLSHFLPSPFSAHTAEAAQKEAFAESWAILAVPKHKHSIPFQAIYSDTFGVVQNIFKQSEHEINALQRVIPAQQSLFRIH